MVKLATLAGFRPYFSPSLEKYEDVLNVIEKLCDNILGVLRNISREKLTFVPKPPPLIRQGWKFATWIQYSMYFSTSDESAFSRVEKVTSIYSSSEKGAWMKAFISVLTRINTICREAVEKTYTTLEDPKDYIQSLEYFREHLLGKKPNGALLWSFELEAITNDYEHRYLALTKKYCEVTDRWSLKQKQSSVSWSNFLRDIMQACAKKERETSEHVAVRASILSTQQRAKRNAPVVRTLIQGGNLEEKIQNKLNWTPAELIRVLFAPIMKIGLEVYRGKLDKVLRAGIGLLLEGDTLDVDAFLELDSDYNGWNCNQKSYFSRSCVIALRVAQGCYHEAAWRTFGTATLPPRKV